MFHEWYTCDRYIPLLGDKQWAFAVLSAAAHRKVRNAVRRRCHQNVVVVAVGLKREVVVVTVADLIWSCKEELLGNVVGNFVGKVVVVRWHCVCNGAVSTENQQRAYCGANIFLCETFSY